MRKKKETNQQPIHDKDTCTICHDYETADAKKYLPPQYTTVIGNHKYSTYDTETVGIFQTTPEVDWNSPEHWRNKTKLRRINAN